MVVFIDNKMTKFCQIALRVLKDLFIKQRWFLFSASVDNHKANYAPLAITGVAQYQVVSVLDSGAEGPGFKSQPRCCRVTVLGRLFTPIVPLFTKQENW